MAVKGGLAGKLGRELIQQALYISLAVIVGVYAVALMLENVLMEQALKGEAEYYWSKVVDDASMPLPDTLNLTAYRAGAGSGIPDRYVGLQEGFHRQKTPRDTLALVTTRGQDRLVLVFEVERVHELVMLFGIIPLALALIVIYVSLYIAYRVSHRAVSPVFELADRVQRLDPADPDPGLFPTMGSQIDDDEITLLNEALSDLTARVISFSERERHFTRDASHELRTPLTVIRIAVDRLFRAQLNQQERETLARIMKSTKDMEELTSAFLLLARDSDQGLAESWVSLVEVVRGEAERAQLINPQSTIELKIVQESDWYISAPEKVIESVIGNLIRNALAYTDAGQVTVFVCPGSIIIEDTGPGMAPDEVEQIFQPYYRNQRQRGGFGVGLTIVKRLTDRFGWPVEIRSELGMGTRVSLEFPKGREIPPEPDFASV